MTKPSDPTHDFEQHARFLRTLASSTLQNHDVEDLVQDCLLVGLQNPPQDSERTFGWLRKVMYRRHAENQRRRNRREQREKSWALSEPQASAYDVVEHRAALKSVTDAVIELSPDQYDLIRLRYFEGMRIKQIAALRDLPTRTVRYRLELALQELRSKLEVKPQGRAALILIGGAATQNVLDLGSWIAMKKLTFALLITVLAIGTLGWAVWINSDDEIVDLEVVETETVKSDFVEARRRPPLRETEDQGIGDAPDVSLIDRERDIFGRVVDITGNPIVGATIVSRVYPWQRMSVLSPRGNEFVTVEKAKSAKDGGFALRHERGDVVELEITKPGFSRLKLTKRVAGEKVEIVLQRACALDVIALRPDGSRLADAHVSLWRQANEKDGGGQFDQRRGTTDENGVVRFDDVSPGALKLYARHVAYLPTAFCEVTLKLDETNKVELEFAEAGTIRGRITDSVTGAGIPRARVTVMGGSLAVETDMEGYFERTGCPKGEGQWFHLKASAKGYASNRRNVRVGQESYDLVLSKGDSVIGRCLDSERNAVAHVRVSLIGSSFRFNGQMIDTGSSLSDLSGHFRIDDLLRTMPHTIILEAPGFGRRHIDLDPFKGKDAGVIDLGDIILHKGLRVAGVVQDENGQVIENAKVRLLGTNADRAERRGEGAGPAQKDYGESEERRTDDLGRFCFPNLMAGDYTLEIEIVGAVPITRPVSLIDVSLEAIEIIVSTPRPLLIRVVDEDHRPIPDATVTLWPEGGSDMTRRTNKLGAASFSGAPSESLTVSVSANPDLGYRYVSGINVLPTETEKVVILERVSPISGKVVGPNGKGIPELQVTARFEDGSEQSVFSGREGAFSIDMVAGSRVSLEVDGSEKQRIARGMYTKKIGPYRGRLDGIVAPISDVLLRVEKEEADLELTVIVRDSEGRPSAGALLYASPATGLKGRRTNAQGEVILRGLYAKALRLQAHPPSLDGGRHFHSKPIEVLPNNQKVVVQLRVAKKLTGKILLENGNAAKRFIVEAVHEGEEHYRTRTDSFGEFELSLVDGLAYTIRTYSRDRQFKGQLEKIKGGPISITVNAAADESK